MLTVRPLRDTDDAAVREIFWSTLSLGQPVAGIAALDAYADLCLDWYLGPDRASAAVLDVDGEVGGYVLVGTKPEQHRRWTRRRALSFGGRTCLQLLGGRHAPPASRFLWLRLRDGWELRRAPAPAPAHAHMNLVRGVRTGSAAVLLRDHVDDVARRAGSPAWYGEINAPAGRRETALRRLGFDVVAQAPNRTLSWLTGTPVERLTVVREVADR